MIRTASRLVWTVPAACVVAAGLAARQPQGGVPVLAVFGLLVVPFAGMGALVVLRRPEQPLGWLLTAVGGIAAAALLGDSYLFSSIGRFPPGDLPLPAPGMLQAPSTSALRLALVATTLWFVPYALMFTVLLPRFPTGRLPSRRWWPLGVAGPLVVGVASCASVVAGWTADLGVAAQLVRSGADPHLEGLLYRGPIDEVATLVLGVLVVASFACVLLRARRSGPVERAQLRWLGWGAAIALLGAAALSSSFVTRRWELFVPALGLVALPASIAAAILRHRLCEIDRLVSRTVAYAAILAVLAAVYGAVLGLLGLVVGADGPLPVAAATLATVGVSAPLRRGVRRAVDRRFDRARYDARRSAAVFRDRMRGVVEIDEVTAALADEVASTVRPAAVGVWLRTGLIRRSDRAGSGTVLRPLGRPRAY